MAERRRARFQLRPIPSAADKHKPEIQPVMHAGCHGEAGSERGRERGRFQYEAGGDFGEGGSFGVRRPLRFLAHKLELDETQVAELASILNDLKTERAQAAVDDRRTVVEIADAAAIIRATSAIST